MAKFKLLTYTKDNTPRSGVLLGGLVYDGAILLEGHGFTEPSSVLGILKEWDKAVEVLQRIAEADISQKNGVTVDSLHLEAPILYPGACYFASSNYYGHSREMSPNREVTREGKLPYFFSKPGASTIIGPGATIKTPSISQKLDWEVELCAVIGRPATQVSAEQALTCVAGFTIGNDLSLRDLIKRADWPYGTDWFSCKIFEGSMPMGPYITPAHDIPDPQNLRISLWVNDQPMQDANTSDMLFSVAELISDLSRRITLRPGDIVATGTPAGCGGPRGIFLKPGDIIRMEVEGIGSMENSVA